MGERERARERREKRKGGEKEGRKKVKWMDFSLKNSTGHTVFVQSKIPHTSIFKDFIVSYLARKSGNLSLEGPLTWWLKQAGRCGGVIQRSPVDGYHYPALPKI